MTSTDKIAEGCRRVRFVDRTDAAEPVLGAEDMWPALVVPKVDLDAEVERLAALAPPANGRRRSLVTHPMSSEPGLGLAPGIQVAIEVLLPGERTRPTRHNSSAIIFCIRGEGFTVVANRRFDFTQYDVLHLPAFETYYHANESSEVQVRLVYTNAALLEKLRVHYVDEQPTETPVVPTEGDAATNDQDTVDVFPLGEDGAYLMSYERLISPEVVEQRPLLWRWADVKVELDRLAGIGQAYRGRRLFLLYNPATGRTNGTSNSFFATITIRPPGIVDRPHRHASAAINYYFSGHGYSDVGCERLRWSAGDLMLSAPGWAVHNHASGDQPVYELTVQDSPLHLAMDSLMWQEDVTESPSLLGSHNGFRTNRDSVIT